MMLRRLKFAAAASTVYVLFLFADDIWYWEAAVNDDSKLVSFKPDLHLLLLVLGLLDLESLLCIRGWPRWPRMTLLRLVRFLFLKKAYVI